MSLSKRLCNIAARSAAGNKIDSPTRAALFPDRIDASADLAVGCSMPFARRFMFAACGNSSQLSSVRGLAKVKTKSLYTHVIRTPILRIHTAAPITATTVPTICSSRPCSLRADFRW